MNLNENSDEIDETNKDFNPTTVLTFYNVMDLLVNEYEIEPVCAPFFWDFLGILFHIDPSLEPIIFKEGDMASTFETKELLGEDNIYLTGEVPVFTENMVRALAIEIKKHDLLYKEFCRHGFISFLDGSYRVGGAFGKDYKEN
ncbi:hypothetical protein [Segetibacter koreensis]|uniref:hypothetical protein n=1 Tax=Segetibacter koreensis TaxID=398037 RepID=UPI00036A8EBE|nr:hypothetical protein [Segetibacter koreensis]